jgi:hypothetical protein
MIHGVTLNDVLGIFKVDGGSYDRRRLCVRGHNELTEAARNIPECLEDALRAIVDAHGQGLKSRTSCITSTRNTVSLYCGNDLCQSVTITLQ